MRMSAGKIITRDWWGPGIKKRPVKKWAFGFSVQHNRKQVRRFKSEWKTAEDAAKGLAAFQLGLAPKTEPARSSCPKFTLGQAAGRYLEMKARKKSIREDRRILEVLQREFGADTALSDLTASRISAYKAKRLAAVSRQSGIGLSTASVNRPLALLRHLLRLAHEEWELLLTVPRIRLEKEPQGRIRWLEPDEEQRLLEACLASPSPWVYPITMIALESGCRRGDGRSSMTSWPDSRVRGKAGCGRSGRSGRPSSRPWWRPSWMTSTSTIPATTSRPGS